MPVSDTQLQLLIDKVLAGDEAARNALLDHACDRLLRLTRKMFHARPDLRPLGADRRRVPERHASAAPGLVGSEARIRAALLQPGCRP